MVCRIQYCQCGKLTIPQRYVTCFMTFFAVLISYTNRVCLHIAITEMAVPIRHNATSGSGGCPESNQTISVTGGTYNWTEKQQGLILAAFFPGYVISHLPGGFMSDVFGAKHVLSSGVALSGLFTLLTPFAVSFGDWWMLVVVRFIIGFVQGPLYPCVSTLLARWVPLRERSTLTAFVSSGNQLGSIAGNLVTSYIMAKINWPTVFYFWGAIALVWYVIFLFTCYSDPSTHPHITEEELAMLKQELGIPVRHKVPWKRIFLDPVSWALLGGQIGHDWIFFLIVVQLPKYLKNVLKFNITQNGILNSIPYLCLWVCSIVTGILADCIFAKNWMSLIHIRQICTFIGNVGPGVCVVMASYFGCNRIAASAMFILGMLIMGPFYAGMKVNVLDITKNFAGIVMALVNGLGSLSFVPVPYVIAVIASDQTVEQWRLVFWILFVGCLVTSVAYIFLTSAERADWDKTEEEVAE